MKPTKTLRGNRHNFTPADLVCHILRGEFCRSSSFLDLRDSDLAAFNVDVGDKHFCPFSCHSDRRTPANTAATAGHQGHLIGQTSHCILPFLLVI